MIRKLSTPKICLRSFAILGSVFVLILLIFYIIQLSQVAKIGFAISSHKSKLAQLFQENKDLQARYCRANSLASLDSVLEDSNYVRVDKVHYIQILGDTIAVKQ